MEGRRTRTEDLLFADTIPRPNRERLYDITSVTVEAGIAEPAGRFEVEGGFEIAGTVVCCPMMYTNGALVECQFLFERVEEVHRFRTSNGT